ncbi:putative branched-chain amino acid aminotransferase [Corchorus olitorius]|uniref:Branched-chain amino acid aminotransferase n=1 Tax=Corchorus olitorius TaxID=93759 RepID=A0A1R3GHC1_9ROSI|nr:putative branched-chain amino acid aminotransferase [Corchorus olitorius]
MCYEVKCSACGKTTWGGCGRHVASVYRRVAEDQRCQCREWPGVNPSDPAQPSSSCSIL